MFSKTIDPGQPFEHWIEERSVRTRIRVLLPDGAEDTLALLLLSGHETALEDASTDVGDLFPATSRGIGREIQALAEHHLQERRI